MGREVKIVSLDFNWFEIHKTGEGTDSETWKGYIFDLDILCFLCDGKGINSNEKKCPLCDGERKINPRFEPPKSWNDNENGYQIWQDVSEGSPVSPVFKKAEDLAKWMTEHDDSITRGTSYQAWLKMIKEVGSCPSGILNINGEFESGMSLYKDKKEMKQE